MGTISPSKFTRLDKLIQIKKDNYVGANGNDYYAPEVDELICEKQTKLDEQEQKEQDKELANGLAKKEELLKLIKLTKTHSHLLRTETLAMFINDIRSEVELLQFL